MKIQKAVDFDAINTTIDWQNMILEPKIDGMRGIYYDDELITANEKTVYNAWHILKALRPIPREFVIDGELYAEEGWEMTMSIFRSMKPVPHAHVARFYIFDILLHDEWVKGYCEIPLIERKRMLQTMFDRCRQKASGEIPIVYVPTFEVPNERAFQRKKDTILRKESGGWYEGIMIKAKHAPYENRRTRSWIKWKPRITEDVTVVDAIEGKGKFSGMVGALICHDANGREVRVPGSGFDDQTRQRLWREFPSLKGKTIEVEFLKRTKNGMMYSAQFRRFRPDK